MKVRINTKNRMIITPETDFEEEYLSRYSSSKVWLKCGLTPADIVGLIIETAPPAREE